MDIHFFLQARLQFLRQLHAGATAPYIERSRRIEAREEPFTPQYEEDGEPEFLDEWLEANSSIQALGKACLSMLAATLKVYLATVERLLAAPRGEASTMAFRESWLKGYLAHIEAITGIRVEESGIDFGLLEEIILARNRVQHPQDIVTEESFFSPADLEKRPQLFFVDERELALLGIEGAQWLVTPAIKVTTEKFEAAVDAIRRLDQWLENQGLFAR